MGKVFIATSKNNKKVYLDAEHSHAATHLADSPKLLELVQEALEFMELNGKEIALQQDMGRIIGKEDLATVSYDDDVFYAKRPNRETFTKFVRGRELRQTQNLTLIFHEIDNDSYELWSAWIGELVPTFPGDEREMPNSKTFWADHALVFSGQKIIDGTETTDCPW